MTEEYVGNVRTEKVSKYSATNEESHEDWKVGTWNDLLVLFYRLKFKLGCRLNHKLRNMNLFPKCDKI